MPTCLFTTSLRNDDVQEFDSKRDLLSMTKSPPDDISSASVNRPMIDQGDLMKPKQINTQKQIKSQITKFSVKVVNLETIIDMQSWSRTWPLTGSRHIRAKKKQKLAKVPADRKPKVIYTDNSLEFGEDLSWNHCISAPHTWIAARAVRRVKEGTSAVLLQSGPNESWWADSGMLHLSANVTDLLSDGKKTPCERRFGQPFEGPIVPFRITLSLRRTSQEIWKESVT